MNVLNNLIEDLLKRTEVRLSDASFTIGLRAGSVKIAGEIPLSVVDKEKPANPKTLANFLVPIQAEIEIKDITFPIPTPK